MSPIAVDVASGERKGAFGGRKCRRESVQAVDVVALVVLCLWWRRIKCCVTIGEGKNKVFGVDRAG